MLNPCDWRAGVKLLQIAANMVNINLRLPLALGVPKYPVIASLWEGAMF
jgi:hypothetical protein